MTLFSDYASIVIGGENGDTILGSFYRMDASESELSERAWPGRKFRILAWLGSHAFTAGGQIFIELIMVARPPFFLTVEL